MQFRNENVILGNATSDALLRLRRDAMDILKTAVGAVDPYKAVRRSLRVTDGRLRCGSADLDLKRFSRIFVVGGGKAGGAMAKAVEELLGARITGGVINVLKGMEDQYSLERIRLNGASHPIPDEDGVAGLEEMLSLVKEADERDLLIVLISGGGSSLMTYPAEGVKLEDVRRLTDLLLRSGATINELNSVRKHISAVKGGLLTKHAYPATVVSPILSDVVGDPLDTIASGPTVPDRTTFRDAIEVLKRRGLWRETPPSIRRRLEKGINGELEETPKSGDEIFDRVHNVIVGSNHTAAMAAVERSSTLGYHSMLLSTRIEGEASHVGTVLAGVAREIAATGNPLPRPGAIISGGETTVTVEGSGLGGRNQELALSAALGIGGLDAVIAALATDGVDGPTEAAGAVADGSTLSRALSMNLEPAKFLAENDSYGFFSALGDVFLTGPTGTNVNDLTLILVSD
jgi:glycerate 2-kinase